MAKIIISDHALKCAKDLYALCVSIHPAVSAQLAKAAKRQIKLTEKAKLNRLEDFLGQYKPEKMGSLQGLLIKLAKEFEAAQKKPVPGHIGLFSVLKQRLGPDLKINFFFDDTNEVDYEDVLVNIAAQNGMAITIPDAACEKHSLTYGDMKPLQAWLKTAASRDSLKDFENRLRGFVMDNQLPAMNCLISHLRDVRLWSPQRISDLMEYLKHDYKQTASIPLYYPPDMTATERQAIDEYKSAANFFTLPLDFVLGIGHGLQGLESKNPQFNRETYKQVRSFLAHEISSIPDLNRMAAMAVLLFPEYENFIAFVSKRAKFDTETHTLRLQEFFDDSNFTFADIDYPAWGQALLQQPDDVFFYFKCAEALNDTPKDKQGRILIGNVRDQLYDKTEYCFENLNAYDIERCDLPLVNELQDIKEHQAKFSHLPDRCDNMSDMILDGASFGKPGWELKRVSYHDVRLYLIGRFTGGNCEVFDKMWGETIRHAVETRKSAFYVTIDAAGKWRAHSWVYPVDMGDVKFAGWEADPADKQEMNEDLFLSINLAIREKYQPNIIFEFGKASRHLNIVPDFLSKDWNREQHDNHKKEVTEKIFTIDELMERGGVAGMTFMNATRADPKGP